MELTQHTEFYDTSSGIANIITFGATNSYQNTLSKYYGNVTANRCSYSYKTGIGAGMMAGLVFGGIGVGTRDIRRSFFGGRLFSNRRVFVRVSFGKYKVMLHQRHGVHLQLEGFRKKPIRWGRHNH